MSSYTRFSALMSIQYDHDASRELGSDHWRVTEGFRFFIGEEGSNSWVFVPAGYLTDGASVPRMLWSYLPPWGVYGQAAVVHDIMCEYLSITKEGRPHRITRKQCDDIFLEAMEVIGVPWARRHIMHKFVSIYRMVAGVNKPSSTALKRSLEAEWKK